MIEKVLEECLEVIVDAFGETTEITSKDFIRQVTNCIQTNNSSKRLLGDGGGSCNFFQTIVFKNVQEVLECIDDTTGNNFCPEPAW